MKILQLTGLVLTVSTLYVWSRTPITSFEPEYGEVISFWTEVESPHWLSGPDKAQAKGTVMELSVYASKYDGRVTRYGRTYDHWHGLTCASNNPKHKNKTLKVTYKGKSTTLMVTDTGGDKRLGYTRLDISGKAMKFFAPKWNGKDKGAPLLKGAVIEVVK